MDEADPAFVGALACRILYGWDWNATMRPTSAEILCSFSVSMQSVRISSGVGSCEGRERERERERESERGEGKENGSESESKGITEQLRDRMSQNNMSKDQ